MEPIFNLKSLPERLLPQKLGCRIVTIAGDWSSLSRMAKKYPVFGHRRFESYRPNKYMLP